MYKSFLVVRSTYISTI